jgi:dCTP deaminase
MGVLCDTQIRELVGIEPFSTNGKRAGQVSFGLSSYGYDVRVGTLFKVFTNVSPRGGQALRRSEGLRRRHVRHDRHRRDRQ